MYSSLVFGESDEIYVTTVLGLDRGNTFEGATVLILGGGDGGILYTLTSLPKPPHHVLMAEVSFQPDSASRERENPLRKLPQFNLGQGWGRRDALNKTYFSL